MLAIGIVVDDAIVVVENTSRHIDQSGMKPKDAATLAMSEVTGPIIATTLVLMAVFVPTAFLGGVTGELYRQFALTIATATVFSSINALTLSPALCALALRTTRTRRNPFFRVFNWSFGETSTQYQRLVGIMVRRTGIVMVFFTILAGLSAWGFASLPTSFLPAEDQGYALVSVQLPDAASFERTADVVEQTNTILANTPGVEGWVGIVGYAVLDGARASNAATIWIIFDPWEEREDPVLSGESLVAQLQQQFRSIQDANLFVFMPPAIQGLGNSGGFQLQIQDRGDVGYDTLQQIAAEMAIDANAQPDLMGVYTTFRANVPQLYADIDRTKAKKLDIPLSNIFATLQAYLGSMYVNDFNRFGRTYQVRVQAESRFRSKSDDVQRLEVRNRAGDMIPLGTLLKLNETLGPQIVTRYNAYPSASVFGSAGTGKSSGIALAAMEQIAESKLPTSMGYEWTGMSLQEKVAGGQAPLIFGLALVFVYLVLCAQYESWSLPMAVILAVPLALVGTLIALKMRGIDNNIYAQIGMVLLIAMASKNAILIVEFARDIRQQQDKNPVEAVIDAARLRFRPILMTALTFILGVLPLVIATGAGAGSRQALGTSVFGGMVAATIFALLFVPVFYIVVRGRQQKNE